MVNHKNSRNDNKRNWETALMDWLSCSKQYNIHKVFWLFGDKLSYILRVIKLDGFYSL